MGALFRVDLIDSLFAPVGNIAASWREKMRFFFSEIDLYERIEVIAVKYTLINPEFSRNFFEELNIGFSINSELIKLKLFKIAYFIMRTSIRDRVSHQNMIKIYVISLKTQSKQSQCPVPHSLSTIFIVIISN